MTTKRTLIRDLSAACLGSRGVNKDWTWSEKQEPDWEAWDVEECEKCGQAVLLTLWQGNEEHSQIGIDGDIACDGHVSLFEGPMMNYWYPIEGQLYPEADAAKLVHLPLCIVKVDDVWGLALTGGGMDLTWEIVEAFTVLGYLPPVHFAKRVPAMCGRGISPKDRYLLKACKRALVVEMRNLRYGMRSLEQTREFGEKHEAERKGADAFVASIEKAIGKTTLAVLDIHAMEKP